MPEYYHDLITEKSFQTLQELRKKYQFILIGGWAIFLYTHSLKSKDIDLVIEYEELEKLRKKFNLVKNNRLKKYEIIIDEINIDIYLPFYSNLGIPAKEIKRYTETREGFIVAKPEVLLVLKQKAYFERVGTPKGEKDKIDIFSLLKNTELNFGLYQKILKEYSLENYREELIKLLKSTTQIIELEINQFQYSKLKNKILEQLNK